MDAADAWPCIPTEAHICCCSWLISCRWCCTTAHKVCSIEEDTDQSVHKVSAVYAAASAGNALMWSHLDPASQHVLDMFWHAVGRYQKTVAVLQQEKYLQGGQQKGLSLFHICSRVCSVLLPEALDVHCLQNCLQHLCCASI